MSEKIKTTIEDEKDMEAGDIWCHIGRESVEFYVVVSVEWHGQTARVMQLKSSCVDGYYMPSDAVCKETFYRVDISFDFYSEDTDYTDFHYLSNGDYLQYWDGEKIRPYTDDD